VHFLSRSSALLITVGDNVDISTRFMMLQVEIEAQGFHALAIGQRRE